MYKPVWLDAQGRAVWLDAQGRAVWLGAQGKAEQQLGKVEWERQRSFVERQSFWVFPLQLPPFQNCIDLMQMVEVE